MVGFGFSAAGSPVGVLSGVGVRRTRVASAAPFRTSAPPQISPGRLRYGPANPNPSHPSNTYWEELAVELKKPSIPLHILLQRGDSPSPNEPLVVLSKPMFIGGQEFDAVIAVGLEQGLVPPRVNNNDALAAALEQQALREIYLSFTRARHQVVILLNHGASESSVITEAKNALLIA